MTKYKFTLNFYYSASLSPVITPNLKNYFSASSTYIIALFDSPFMLRQPQKSAQADALWTKLTPEPKTQIKGNVQYALDGVPRPRVSPTYKSIVRLVLYLLAKEIRKTNMQ